MATLHCVCCLVPFFCLSTGCSTITPEDSPEGRRSIVLGYYPSWNPSLPPSQINYAQFTHLCHAFVAADAQGNLKTGGNLPSRELTALAHRHDVRVLVSLGGMDSGEYFSPLLRDPAAAERFVQDVVNLVYEYNYDGIDLNWEFPRDAEDMRNLTWMARRFRELLDARTPGALLTTAQPGVDWAARYFDHEALRDTFDLVAVMTYDMHGPWTGHAGHNAPLYKDPKDRPECQAIKSFPDYLAYWTDQKGFKKSQLIVGVPCYGRGFPVNAWHESFTRDAKPAYPYVAHKNIPALLADGWVRHWDDDIASPWLSKPGVKELISYDDEESAFLKGQWAGEQGFAGVFVWEISQDFSNGRHAIVRAATQGFITPSSSASTSPQIP